MTFSKLVVAVGIVAASLAVSTPVQAQRRGGGRGGGGAAVSRAVPRGPSARIIGPRGFGVARPLYRPAYRPGVSLGFYYGLGYGYGGFGYGYGYPYGYYGYAYPGYPYAYGYPAYGYGVAVRSYGGVRIDVAQKDAEVWSDGYFVGTVRDFDGTFQQLSLEPGPHRIEVRAAGFEPVAFDVNVEPGRTITYRAALRPLGP